jgi:dienelactone hydrolase
MHRAIAAFTLIACAAAGRGQTLPGVAPLTEGGDFAARMTAGIDRYLLRALAESRARRAQRWKPDFTSPAAYAKSTAPNRERLRRLIGAVDARVPYAAPWLETRVGGSAEIARTPLFRAYAVRWPVFAGVDAEGVLLEPVGAPRARVVAIPDADQSPEAFAFGPARRLAENGCLVLVPAIIDRKDTWSGDDRFSFTNQTHREFLYRMAFQMGRHIIGYEVQKALAAVDWFAAAAPRAPIGVFGYGEGGLIALHAAALDPRIAAAVVSGYFDEREAVWREPLYRNVWSLLTEFGDAEVAALIAPRRLIVEAAKGPEIDGPPAPDAKHKRAAAPGQLATPAIERVRTEVERARPAFARLGAADHLRLVESGAGLGAPASPAAIEGFLRALGIARAPRPAAAAPASIAKVDADTRMHRQFQQLIDHTQRLVAEAPFERARFWAKADATSVTAWEKSKQQYRDYFWEQVIGKLPPPSEPMAAKARVAYDRPKWTGYDVTIPVWPDVFAYGVLLVPKDLKPGEQRPVVVCQHGLEGTPQSTIDPPARPDGSRRRPWVSELASEGFIVYAPQNPYRGEENFRTLVRKANPLQLSLFSFILGQHERTLEWLATLPFVDAKRIGFYGISYGGKTAMRVPALLDRYALSICSADFNEWIWKTTRLDMPSSYLYTKEYEVNEFDLGNTFNHGEMAMLLAPRPFMVERGHHDGVSIDEWVAYEYAKVRRFYTQLGVPGATEIEFFNGPHTIHGEGTYAFLRRHLAWPGRK